MFQNHKDIQRMPRNSKKQETLFKCEFCPEKYPSTFEVILHKNTKHKELIEDFFDTQPLKMCPNCFTHHKTEEDLTKHILTEHLYSSENAKRVERHIYVCNECEQVFFNKDHLTLHLLLGHTYFETHEKRKDKLMCPICGKYVIYYNLWYHLRYHELGETETCYICLEYQESKEELHKHIKTHLCYLFCDICGFITTISNVFQNHARQHKNKHSSLPENYKNFFIGQWTKVIWPSGRNVCHRGVMLPKNMKICVLCREICTDDKDMMNHIANHYYSQMTEKKIHRCSCGEEFTMKVLLKKHVFSLKGHSSIQS